MISRPFPSHRFRRLFWTFILLFGGITAFSYGSEIPKRLFIHSEPIDARVFYDGIELEKRTPLVIESPEIGDHTVRIELTGFSSNETRITIDDSPVSVIEAGLDPDGAVIFFQDGVVINPRGDRIDPGGFALPSGLYRVGVSDDIGSLAPVYPHQQWIDGLNIAVPIVTAVTGGLLIFESVSPRTAGVISPFSISALVTDILLIGADIGFHIHRAKWRNQWQMDKAEAAVRWAETDFRKAEAELEAGNWAEAEILFKRFVMLYPLDVRCPDALYRSARLAYLQQNYQAGQEHLTRLFDFYPSPGIWDRAWRLSAEFAFKQSRPREGLAALNNIYGFDESVDLESIAVRKADILTDIARDSRSLVDAKAALKAWESLVVQWPGSEFVENYLAMRDQVSAAIRDASGVSSSP